MKIEQEKKIKQLFHGTLKPEDRIELNSYDFVDEVLHKQWKEMDAASIDPVREERILKNILKTVNHKQLNHFRNSLYHYGMAAMIITCLVISAFMLWSDPKQEIVYVMTTGYQSMDSVKLADGTKVMLGAGSRITYPKEFSGSHREIELSGQAFFNVTPDKKHSFVVKTQKMDITVMGTSFEVFSYDGDETVETILLTGKVKVDILGEKKAYTLKPNEKLAYSKREGVSLNTIDANAYSSWRQGKRMSFKNETLEMILERLEKWYGQKIECDLQTARYYRFTFTVRGEPLELVLNYISHSAPLNYQLVSHDHYVIKERK